MFTYLKKKKAAIPKARSVATSSKPGRTWQEHVKGIVKSRHPRRRTTVDLEAGAESSSAPVLADSDSEYEDVDDEGVAETGEGGVTGMGLVGVAQNIASDGMPGIEIDIDMSSSNFAAGMEAAAAINDETDADAAVANAGSNANTVDARATILSAGANDDTDAHGTTTARLGTTTTRFKVGHPGTRLRKTRVKKEQEKSSRTPQEQQSYARGKTMTKLFLQMSAAFLSIGDTFGIWIIQDSKILFWYFGGAFDEAKKMSKKETFGRAVRGALVWALLVTLLFYGLKGGRYVFEHFTLQIGGGQFSMGWTTDANATTTATEAAAAATASATATTLAPVNGTA
ncbi:hypothetical protein CALCODRAFT_508046 [Calocera cornea HHB12733]|uniref:Uncharacterized protein n=1 Tax=Calocera cornea HHB12733 TaxID=1353952 RepID=A0A165GWW4_9BASI|nr:hypothetical protein CALCODRAFT_508046 [Calocera cornea HHB12733]